MALNDLEFQIPRPASWGSAVFFVVAAGLVALGVVTGSTGAAIGAILPATIAVALLASRRSEIEGSVTDRGIELTRPPMTIAFESIKQIDGAPSSSPSFKIGVHHEMGLLKIPAAPDINSEGIHRALAARFNPSGSRAVNPLLADYVARNDATFGPDRVWTFCANAVRGKDVHKSRAGMAVSLAILVTGLAWLAMGAAGVGGAKDPSVLCGILIFIGGFGVPIAWLSNRPSQIVGIKNWKEASLAISPVGLAMIQGDVKGELAWDQLRDVKYAGKGKSFRLSNDANLYGIVLVVEGARIVVADLYDRPLPLIHERILRYWKPERAKSPIDL
jgi:hypothetical protein